ncbi:hypothetical protein KO361_01230 [Candidatus Woesearchaeota archaeon]|nr:hypothetical protein [Candidatus Woesearchaeota archaeon]
MKTVDSVSRGKQEKSTKLLFDSLSKKTNYYLNKPLVTDSDLYYFVKDFFREFLDINHELSFDEIIRELDKVFVNKEVKKAVVDYVNKIKAVEYKDSFFDEEKIRDLIKEFYDVVKFLRSEEKKEKSFFYNFFRKLGLVSSNDDDVSEGITFEIDTSKLSDDVSSNDEGVVSSVGESKIIKDAVDSKVKDDEVVSDLPSSDSNDIVDSVIKDNNKKISDTDKVADSSVKDEIIKSDEKDLSGFDAGNNFSEDVVSSSVGVIDDSWSKTKDVKNNVKSDDWLKDVNVKKTKVSKEFSGEVSVVSDSSKDVSESVDKSVNDVSDEEVPVVNDSEDIKESSVSEDVDVKDVFRLLDDSMSLVDKDDLVSVYISVNDLYEKLSKDEKTKVYPLLVSLYERISKL